MQSDPKLMRPDEKQTTRRIRPDPASNSQLQALSSQALIMDVRMHVSTMRVHAACAIIVLYFFIYIAPRTQTVGLVNIAQIILILSA